MTETPYTFELADPPPSAGAGRPLDPKAVAAIEFATAHPDRWFIYDTATRDGLDAGKAQTAMLNRLSGIRKAAQRFGVPGKLASRTSTNGDTITGYLRLESPKPRQDSPTEALDGPPAPAGDQAPESG